jgi:hypothetical protein
LRPNGLDETAAARPGRVACIARELAAILPVLPVRRACRSGISQEHAMKVNIEIDCTPEEARQFMGLPDVQPMQNAMMDKLQQKMSENIEKFSPEAILQNWFTFDPKMTERFQDMFVNMAGLGMGRTKDKT